MMCHVWLTDDEASELRETDVCEGTTTHLTPPSSRNSSTSFPSLKFLLENWRTADYCKLCQEAEDIHVTK